MKSRLLILGYLEGLHIWTLSLPLTSSSFTLRLLHYLQPQWSSFYSLTKKTGYSFLKAPALATLGLRIFLLPQHPSFSFSSHVSGLQLGEASFHKSPLSLSSPITKPCIILLFIITPGFISHLFLHLLFTSFPSAGKFHERDWKQPSHPQYLLPYFQADS